MYATVIVKKLIMVRGVPSRLTPQYSDSCRRRQFMRTNVTRQFRSRERKWVRTKRPGTGIGDYASVTQGDWTGAGSTACTPTDPPGAAPDWRGRVWYLGNTIALLTQSRLTHACLWDEEYWLRCWCNSQYSSLYDCVWWAESACVLLQTLVYVLISRTYRENGWIIFFRHAWQVCTSVVTVAVTYAIRTLFRLCGGLKLRPWRAGPKKRFVIRQRAFVWK